MSFWDEALKLFLSVLLLEALHNGFALDARRITLEFGDNLEVRMGPLLPTRSRLYAIRWKICLVDRGHHNQIDPPMLEFRRNAQCRMKGNQVEALLGRLNLHRVVDRDQERRLKVENRGAHDFFRAGRTPRAKSHFRLRWAATGAEPYCLMEVANL
jgi:hypothetical protein